MIRAALLQQLVTHLSDTDALYVFLQCCFVVVMIALRQIIEYMCPDQFFCRIDPSIEIDCTDKSLKRI